MIIYWLVPNLKIALKDNCAPVISDAGPQYPAIGEVRHLARLAGDRNAALARAAPAARERKLRAASRRRAKTMRWASAAA